MKNIRNQIQERIWGQIREQIRLDQINTDIPTQVWEQLRQWQIDEQVWGQLWWHTVNQLKEQLRK